MSLKTVLLILSASALSLSFIKKTLPEKIGAITFVLGKSGEVRILRVEQDLWLPAKTKMPVHLGDKLNTQAESRCEIKLNDGSIIRIGESSQFDFEKSLLANKKRSFDASLAQGKIWANIVSLVWGEKFEIKSPTAVCAIRGTIYSIDADSTTRVAVYDGQVDVGPTQALREQLQRTPRPAGPPQQIPGPTQVPGPYQVSLEQWVRLVKGYQLEVRPNGRYAQTPIDPQRDLQNDWVQWNLGRDREVKRD
jgi:hypothetical protein